MQRDSVLQILAKYKNDNFDKYGIDELGVFGSIARDEATSQSDVDICIKTKTADMFMMVHIKDELQTLLSAQVDIVRVREKMNTFLKKRIERDAVYV